MGTWGLGSQLYTERLPWSYQLLFTQGLDLKGRDEKGFLDRTQILKDGLFLVPAADAVQNSSPNIQKTQGKVFGS